MLNLTGNAAIDVFIGLAFFYFLLSVVCSTVNEGIATALNLRAEDLERGIRNLLDDPTAFYAHWRVQALFKPKRFLAGVPQLGKLLSDKRPSYIPSRVFALTVLDTIAPAPGSDQSHDLIARANAAIKDLPDGKVKGLLQDAVDQAGGDAERFRAGLETSFNEAMDRVSGWYKRRTQLILFVVALVVVAAINADSFSIGQRLWKNDALRTAVVAQATKTGGACAKTSTTATAAQIAGKCLDQVEQLGLPLGWSSATSPSGWGIAGKIGGLLVTAFAVLLGAPFWFDVLGKVAKLRSAGNTPDTSAGQGTKPAPAPAPQPAATPPAGGSPPPPSVAEKP